MVLNCGGNHVRPDAIVEDCVVIVVRVWHDIGDHYGVGCRNIIRCPVIAEVSIGMAFDCVKIDQAILAKKISIHRSYCPTNCSARDLFCQLYPL
eukprot:12118131-Ditylum_brightwellii.AAC.1